MFCQIDLLEPIWLKKAELKESSNVVNVGIKGFYGKIKSYLQWGSI